jgi:hypothetical protein
MSDTPDPDAPDPMPTILDVPARETGVDDPELDPSTDPEQDPPPSSSKDRAIDPEGGDDMAPGLGVLDPDGDVPEPNEPA